VQDLDRGAREGLRHALDAGGRAGRGDTARRARFGRLSGFLGHPPAPDAPAAVPADPSPSTRDHCRARPDRGGCPAAGPARTHTSGVTARPADHRGPRRPGTPPRYDASVAPRAHRARPLCLTLSQSWGAPHVTSPLAGGAVFMIECIYYRSNATA